MCAKVVSESTSTKKGSLSSLRKDGMARNSLKGWHVFTTQIDSSFNILIRVGTLSFDRGSVMAMTSQGVWPEWRSLLGGPGIDVCQAEKVVLG